MEIATSQAGLKIAVGLIIFLPAYGFLLRYLNGRLVDAPVVEAKPKAKAKAKAPAKKTTAKKKATK
jgi:hypothetical protein